MPPVNESACKIPTEADELCMIAVMPNPISMPSKGFENFPINAMKDALSDRGDTAELITDMPNIRMAKLTNIEPRSVLFLLWKT